MLDRFWLPACLLLFIGAGSLFVSSLGLQSDEALFGAGIYEPASPVYSAQVFRHHVPLMSMSYLGCLKAWIYAPLFAVWQPSNLSVRLPAILAGAATIGLVYRLLRQVSGRSAARIAAVLLAGDATFVLTTTLDWGPVALQHLLTAGGALSLTCFFRSGRMRTLGLGFFLFGLGTWDKAVFLWMLGGLGMAAIVMLRGELWRLLTPRTVALAAVCYCAGAAPLIAHNVRHPLATLRAQGFVSAADLPWKASMLRHTLAGSGLLGYLVRDQPGPAPRLPVSVVERASVQLSEIAGAHESWFPYACIAGIAFLPWLRSRRVAVFALIAFSIAWGLMLLAGGGGAPHHIVLLWPLPHIIVAESLAGLSERFHRARPVAVALAAVVVLSSLLVVNEHKSWLVRNGSGRNWTDAIDPLAASLGRVKAETIFVVDWGMLDQLILLHKGTLPLRGGIDPLDKTDFRPDHRKAVVSWLRTPAALFVAHADGEQVFPGVNDRLRGIAAEEGFDRTVIDRISDLHGRPMFEICRFEARRQAGFARPDGNSQSGSAGME